MRPEGAGHQWRKAPPKHLSVALEAGERVKSRLNQVAHERSSAIESIERRTSKDELQAAYISKIRGVFSKPLNPHERGDRHRDLGEANFAPHDLRDLQQLIGQQAKTSGADILNSPSDDKVPLFLEPEQ